MCQICGHNLLNCVAIFGSNLSLFFFLFESSGNAVGGHLFRTSFWRFWFLFSRRSPAFFISLVFSFFRGVLPGLVGKWVSGA